MNARWRKIFFDLTANKIRTVLAILSLAIGTAAVGAMHFAGATIGPSFEQSFLSTNPPSAMLRTTDFPAALIDEVTAHPAVGQAEGRRLLVTRARRPDSTTATLELVAMVDFSDNKVAVIEPVDGAWPPVGAAAVVEQASVSHLGTNVGDVLTIESGGLPPIELDVVGTARDVYEVAPSLGGFARVYVSMDTMSGLVGSDTLNTLYVRATVEPLDRDAALAMTTAVRNDVLSPDGIAIELSEIGEPSEHRASTGVLFMVPTMQILSGFALVVAVALIVNTVAALLVEQRRLVGVMKAIGATSRQLQVQYLAYVSVLGLAAFVLAVPMSLLGGRLLSSYTADLANFELGAMTVPWTTVAVELAIVVAVPGIAVLVLVRRACAVTVSDAVADRGLASSQVSDLHPRPLSRPTLLALRNALRNPMRLALTVLSIAGCGAVLVGVMSSSRSLDTLTEQVSGYWDYDVELTFSAPVTLEEVNAAFGEDRAVASVEGWYRSQAFRLRPDGTENENIGITALPHGSPSIRPTVLSGRWFETSDDHPIVINTHFAEEESDVIIGDDVILNIEGRRRAWTVVGIATTTLVGPVAYVPVDDLTDDIGRSGATNWATFQLEPGSAQDAVAERLDAAARDAGLPVAQVRTNDEQRAYVDGLFALVVGFLLLVGVILGVVAVIGVAGTMTLSVAEQTREIGVIRTLGASDWAVRRLFLLQGLAAAATGVGLGVVLSLPVAWLLRSAIGDSLIDASLPAGFSWVGVGVWAVIGLVIGVGGATRPARVAAHLTVSDTLAYE